MNATLKQEHSTKKRFDPGDSVIMEMSDGKKIRCTVMGIDWPTMTLKITDENATDPEWENGEVVKIELEAVN